MDLQLRIEPDHKPIDPAPLERADDHLEHQWVGPGVYLCAEGDMLILI